ncbi:MAG: hypothetical protein AABX55_00395, partial [Nanoarchaeota archaeon]
MKKYYYYLFGLIALIISFIFDKQIISFIVANRLEFLNKFFILLDYINGFVIFIISLAILYFNKDKKRIPYLILAFLFYAVIVFFLKEFIARHMKVENRDLNKVKIDKDLNQFMWARGIRKHPHKIKVKVALNFLGEAPAV